MKNVLVIGGSYFVGRVFVEELSKDNEYSIYVMNRGNKPLNLEGVQEIQCDRHDALTLEMAVPPLEWHALVDFCAYEPNDIEMLLYSLPGSLRHYIYFSTATVHENAVELPMKEESTTLMGPLPGPHGDYGFKKWQTEIRLKKLCAEKDIPYTALRPSFVYGKYNYAPREAYFFKLLHENKPIVVPIAPQGLFSVVSVWDIANLTKACIGNEKAFNRPFILAADELVSYDRIVQVLEEITHQKLNPRRLSIAEIDQQRIPLPFPLEEHLIYSGEATKKAFEYEYMTFLEGMTKSYNHFFGIEKN